MLRAVKKQMLERNHFKTDFYFVTTESIIVELIMLTHFMIMA